MIKLTRREVAAYNVMSDADIAKAWLRLDGERVATGKNKGQPTRAAMKAGDKLIYVAAGRKLSLPCEGETFDAWEARMQRKCDFG